MAENFMLVPSGLGWMGIAGAGSRVRFLTFGHLDPEAAHRALIGRGLRGGVRRRVWNRELVDRLQRYAEGRVVSFEDVVVVMDQLRPFTRRVLEQCRRIPWGATTSYGRLAADCRRPRAARAVGAAMACNPVSLIIPCHRVIASDGTLRGYSAPGGLETKRRLLRLEGRAWGPRSSVGESDRDALRSVHDHSPVAAADYAVS